MGTGIDMLFVFFFVRVTPRKVRHMGRSTTKKDMEAPTVKPGLQDALQRGIAAAEKGEREEAHSIFKETAELHPDVADVWVWLGGTSPQLDEAEQAFEKAHALDPSNEKAALGLRWVQLRKTPAVASPVTGAAMPTPPSPVWDQVLQPQPEVSATAEAPRQVAEGPARDAVEVPEVPAQPATPVPIWERQSSEVASDTSAAGNSTSGGWLSNNLRLAILLVLVVVLAVFVFLLIR